MPEASSNFPYRLGVCDPGMYLAWLMFFSTWYPPPSVLINIHNTIQTNSPKVRSQENPESSKSRPS